jgi:hypothetical protein
MLELLIAIGFNVILSASLRRSSSISIGLANGATRVSRMLAWRWAYSETTLLKQPAPRR